MKRTAHLILNICLLSLLVVIATPSCTTANSNLAGVPPIKFVGTYKGKPVSVTVYPDGSHPTEVQVGNGGLDEPVVIDIN